MVVNMSGFEKITDIWKGFDGEMLLLSLSTDKASRLHIQLMLAASENFT
jgi:hypothetical protein